MLYIAGIIKANEFGSADKTYYCMGSDTDGSCGTHADQKPCVHTVDDSDRNRVTSDVVSRFTFRQLKRAVGGKLYPEKKFKVIRHAAVHLSMREPTESDITFYTLLWRQHEIQKTPWERPKDYRDSQRFPIIPWYFNTGGNSILHSRLHGIDCDYPGNSGGGAVPSCSSGTNADVCSGAPCGPGAICKNFDGRALCLCREGLVGDGYECAFPSETGFNDLATAHELASLGNGFYKCFPADSSLWPTFTNEATLPPYPGGQAPYAPTSCHDFGVCPVDWRCDKNRGCLPPTGRQTCENKGFSRGQCEAMGCCKWDPSQSGGDKCIRQQEWACPKPEDKTTDGAKCDDQETCCYFGCNSLELSDDGLQFGQKGNCQKDCKIGIAPAYNGVIYEEVFLLPDMYYTNEAGYAYGMGPLEIQGRNKNMFERCSNVCLGDQEDDPTAVFLKNIRRKDGKVMKKTCKWLKNRSDKQQRRFCRGTLATQGYKPAKDVCTDICANYM